MNCLKCLLSSENGILSESISSLETKEIHRHHIMWIEGLGYNNCVMLCQNLLHKKQQMHRNLSRDSIWFCFPMLQSSLSPPSSFTRHYIQIRLHWWSDCMGCAHNEWYQSNKKLPKLSSFSTFGVLYSAQWWFPHPLVWLF